MVSSTLSLVRVSARSRYCSCEKRWVDRLRASVGTGEAVNFTSISKQISQTNRTPTKEHEKPPNPTSITEEQLEFFGKQIAAHIKEVLDRTIADGRDGDGEVYEL